MQKSVGEIIAQNPYAQRFPSALVKPSEETITFCEMRVYAAFQTTLLSACLTSGSFLSNNWPWFGFGAAGGGGLGYLYGLIKECVSPSQLSVWEDMKATAVSGVVLKTAAKVGAVSILVAYAGGVVVGTYFYPSEFSIYNGLVLAIPLSAILGNATAGAIAKCRQRREYEKLPNT